MKVKILKANNGISMMDVIVAILILCMFVGVIGNLYYQIALQSNKIRYNAIAVYYTVKIAEYTDIISYEEVTNDLNNSLKEKYEIPDLFNVTVNVEDYNKEDTSKKDIIKLVTIRIEYEVLGEPQIYQVKKLKVKEM